MAPKTSKKKHPKKKQPKKDDDVPDEVIRFPCTLCGKKNVGKKTEDWKVYLTPEEIPDHYAEVHPEDIIAKKVEEQKPPWLVEMEKLEKQGFSWTVILNHPQGAIDVQSNLIRPGLPAPFIMGWERLIEIVYENRDSFSKLKVGGK